MTPLFRAYTPRPLPLNYDALASDLGCQTIDGVRVFDFLELVQICIFEPSELSSSFLTKGGLVSYFPGPALAPIFGPGYEEKSAPFRYGWAAWIANNSVRSGQFTAITPPAAALGTASQLFASFSDPKPTWISGAFNRVGFMHLALQTSADTITLRYYGDSTGAIEEVTWLGKSPLLWFNGNIFNTPDPERSEVVALYLRPELPRTIFARFESEDFAEEYAVVEDLPVSMVSILHAETDRSSRLVIYGIDDQGRDVKIYSTPYFIEATEHPTTLDVGWFIGFNYDTAVVFDTGNPDKNSIACAWVSGYMQTVTVPTTEPLNANQNKCSLSLVWVEGDHS